MGSPSKPTPPPREEEIGMQERPLETTYYDLLGVPVDATTDEIKNAYRYLTIRCVYHRDKNLRPYPNAGERVQTISIAYQTLSDPQLRHKYNEFGPEESAPEGGFVDPDELFGLILCGERFLPFIGQLAFSQQIKELKTISPGADAMEGDARGGRNSTQLSAARNARIPKLAENLCNRLNFFTENATSPTDPGVTESWRRICSREADELVEGEMYGVELLNSIGFIYTAKAKQFFASNRSFLGIGGWLYIVQGKYYMVSDMLSTIRSAKQRNAIFDQIQQGDVSGTLNAEGKKRLEKRALEKGLQTLLTATKVDINWALRDTCDMVLNDPMISHNTAVLRAAALQTLGDVFMAVRHG